MRVLTVNTGSSSVKLRLLGTDDAVLGEHEADAPGTEVDPDALRAALEGLGAVDVVAHRIVHGGRRAAAALIDDSVLAEVRELTPLAPRRDRRRAARSRPTARCPSRACSGRRPRPS
jgi:acetate kinase